MDGSVRVFVWPHDTAYLLRRRKCGPEGFALLLDLVVWWMERRLKGGRGSECAVPVADSLTAPRDTRYKVYQATKFSVHRDPQQLLRHSTPHLGNTTGEWMGWR